jgi:hypothetical protein
MTEKGNFCYITRNCSDAILVFSLIVYSNRTIVDLQYFNTTAGEGGLLPPSLPINTAASRKKRQAEQTTDPLAELQQARDTIYSFFEAFNNNPNQEGPSPKFDLDSMTVSSIGKKTEYLCKS